MESPLIESTHRVVASDETLKLHEKEFVSNFVNVVCAHDPELALRHIPLKVGDPDNIFIRIKDGLILSKLLNLIRPQCVDCSKLLISPKATADQKRENLEIVLAGAARNAIDLKIESVKDILSAVYV